MKDQTRNIQVKETPQSVNWWGEWDIVREIKSVSNKQPKEAKHDAKEEKTEIDTTALAFFDKVTTDKKEPVAFFALEWCEFCWSVRKFFKEVGISHRAIDLDSVEYQKDNLGVKLRPVLAEKTGAKTIPQIFIGGELVGGATDIFDNWKDGTLQKMLDKNNVSYDKDKEIDPYTLLPTWLHPR